MDWLRKDIRYELQQNEKNRQVDNRGSMANKRGLWSKEWYCIAVNRFSLNGRRRNLNGIWVVLVFVNVSFQI